MNLYFYLFIYFTSKWLDENENLVAMMMLSVVDGVHGMLDETSTTMSILSGYLSNPKYKFKYIINIQFSFLFFFSFISFIKASHNAFHCRPDFIRLDFLYFI
jgi:predicted butyrate kinase (DUF1464 family)